jgi:nucleoside-diphosphate-sugar epimerase
MKICIIGGSGFIGTHLINKLNESSNNTIVFDKNICASTKNSIIGDIRDKSALVKALSGVKVIYNLAAEHRDDVTPTSLYYDVNVQGARNIVEAAELNNINKIIFTSTVAVYGLNKKIPDESSPTEPFNHYGQSKLQAEAVFNEWVTKSSDHTLVTVRPVVIFGEGNKGNVYNLIKQIKSSKFLMVGLGENCKSMAYVGNIANFLASATEFGPGKHLFNFATKPDMTVRELVSFVRTELGMTAPLPKLPYSLGLAGGFTFDVLAKLTGKKFPISSIRIRKFCANTTVSTKALDELGFKPPFTLQEGLNRMIANLDQNIYFEGGG